MMRWPWQRRHKPKLTISDKMLLNQCYLALRDCERMLDNGMPIEPEDIYLWFRVRKNAKVLIEEIEARDLNAN